MLSFGRLLRSSVGTANSSGSICARKSVRGRGKRNHATHFRPRLEDLEVRIVPSFADGNGAVVTNVTMQNNGAQLVITFDGPLNAAPSNPVQSPTNTANYSVQVPLGNPEVVTSSASSVAITSASYNSGTFQVTLNLGSALASADDLAGAEKSWNQARPLFESLATDYPETADHHGLLGMTLGLLGWLRAKVHSQGQRYRPAELIEHITGSKPDHRPLIDGLCKKYGELYKI